MTQKQALIAVVTVLLSFTLINLAACAEPLLDESFSVSDTDYGRSFGRSLTAGDKISINITTVGSKISFGIFNSSTEVIYDKENITSLFEDWTAPYNDTFDFFVTTYQGVSDVHLIVQITAHGQAGGAGVDPLIMVVVAVVIVAVLVAVFFVLRGRKQPQMQPEMPLPPPPPPPP
jgi:hypothetical protein